MELDAAAVFCRWHMLAHAYHRRNSWSGHYDLQEEAKVDSPCEPLSHVEAQTMMRIVVLSFALSPQF